MAESPIISCCVDQAVKAAVEELAAERRWTRSATAAWLIERALDDLDRQREASRMVEVRVDAAEIT